jgi:nicotinamide-nucleotide amidase
MVSVHSQHNGSEDPAEIANSIAERVGDRESTVSVAESMTSGLIATRLGAAEGAGQWFRGGVVAYASEVKFKVLGVDPGPVITARCAQQMARGVRELTGSDLAVAVTGVGGPDEAEGNPPGTAFIAVSSEHTDRAHRYHFPGDTTEVVQATTVQALRLLLAELEP